VDKGARGNAIVTRRFRGADVTIISGEVRASLGTANGSSSSDFHRRFYDAKRGIRFFLGLDSGGGPTEERIGRCAFGLRVRTSVRGEEYRVGRAPGAGCDGERRSRSVRDFGRRTIEILSFERTGGRPWIARVRAQGCGGSRIGLA